MSVVDTWNWDKLKPTEEEFKIDANMKVHLALNDFENAFGIRPNRIIMGYHLLDEITSMFYDMNIPMKTLEEMAKEQKLGVYCKYEGIPIKIDYDNPNTLEVGCIMSFTHRG